MRGDRSIHTRLTLLVCVALLLGCACAKAPWHRPAGSHVLVQPGAGETLAGVAETHGGADVDLRALDLGLRVDGYPLVPVLFYRWDDAGLAPGRIQGDLNVLKSRGHEILTPSDFLAFIRMETAVPMGAVLLAFEPGTKAQDFKTLAPLLSSQIGAGLLFVDPAVVGTPGALTWDEVRLFVDMGFEAALVPGSGRSLSAPQEKETLVGYARRVKKKIALSAGNLVRGAGVQVRFAAYPDGVGNSVMAAAMASLKIQGVFRDGGEGNPFFCDAFRLERMDAGQRGRGVPLDRYLDTFRKAELAW